jgi:small subunit ribosomal protein S13
VKLVPQKLFVDKEYWQKSADFRQLIRIIGTSVEGHRTMLTGLSVIRGIGPRLALAVCRIAGYSPQYRIGLLSDAKIEELEKIIKNPMAYGVPKWMVNRQKDVRTGEYRHITGNEIDMILKQDLDRMKRLRSWKGVRHMYNLKVRGQHTRTTGRKGLTIGYMRQKLKKKTGEK